MTLHMYAWCCQGCVPHREQTPVNTPAQHPAQERVVDGYTRQAWVHLQDDLLHETLTVTEVLYYAAMLRLPRTMTAEAKSARVMTVVRALGIEACKDTIIGARTLLAHPC